MLLGVAWLSVALCVQAADRAFQTLLQVQQRDGQLRLNHFRRVKQLGAGDVGLVDLVQLQVRSAGEGCAASVMMGRTARPGGSDSSCPRLAC